MVRSGAGLHAHAARHGGVVGGHGTTYAAQYWLKIYQRNNAHLDMCLLVTDALSMGMTYPSSADRVYHDLGREGEARGLLVRRPHGRGAAYGDDDFHEGDPRKPTGTAGSAASELHVVFFRAVGRGLDLLVLSANKVDGLGPEDVLKDFNWLDVFLLFWVMNTLMLVLFAGGSGGGLGAPLGPEITEIAQIIEGIEVAHSVSITEVREVHDPLMYQIKWFRGGSPHKLALKNY